MNKKKGTLTLELLLGTLLIGLVISLLTPITKIYYKNYLKLKETSSIKEVSILTSEISNYVFSTTIETENRDLYAIPNLGIGVFKFKNERLANRTIYLKNNSVVFGEEGDTLYIENPILTLKEGGAIGFSNEYTIFRFFESYSTTGKNNIELRHLKNNENYSNMPGNRNNIFRLGTEETLLKGLKKGVFYEVEGGVIMEFQGKEGTKYKELFLRYPY